jgi:chemotaxis protein methyltransferase CheR
MTLFEALTNPRLWDIRILATDIDTEVLAAAERGIYSSERVSTIPEPLLRQHFLRNRSAEDPSYQVKPHIRELIKFKQINLLDKDWPIRSHVRFDLLFCRNVVIYFDQETRSRLFARYQSVIVPGGHLFIGHSETLYGINDEFNSLGSTVYQLPNRAIGKAA